MIKVAIVGLGFMGRMHYRCWKGRDDAEVVAVCDENPNIKADTQKAVGNIDGAAEAIDFSEFTLYTDLKEMLAKEQLDAVSITLPTWLHPENTVTALSAGVHVLCEKPMALTVAECDQMIEAARSSGKILQIGHCVRFWPEYAKAKEIIEEGEYGGVIAASFRRLGAAPSWGAEGWFMNEKRSGGMTLDLHIHDTDYIQYLFGVPQEVYSREATTAGGSALHVVTQYVYGDGKAIVAEGGWSMASSFGFEMSFNIMLERATLVYDCTRKPMFRVCPDKAEAFTPKVAGGDGYVREIDYFARMVQGETVKPVTTLEQSRDSVKIVAAERESARTGKGVQL